MGKKTRTMTLAAVFSAMTVVSLYVASVWPTGQLGLVAFASLFAAAAVIEAGLANGVSVFIISSTLGMLILPNRSAPMLYVLFFGYYPVLKSLFERSRHRVVEWVLKLLVFNAALTMVWFLLREIIFDFGENVPNALFIYVGGSLVFVIFDYGFTKLVWLYLSRISRFMRK